MDNKCFCTKCMKATSYHAEELDKQASLHGGEYSYVGLNAICDICGERVGAHCVDDEDLKRLYAVVRCQNGILSKEQINEIPKKYNIGKKPLSVLLGWGDTTFIRYCHGDIPAKQYRDILNKIYNDPTFYLKLLEDGKDRITDIAYKKSKRAAEHLV